MWRVVVVFNVNTKLSPRLRVPGGGGGDSAYERCEMLVVSLRGVNFGFGLT